VSETLIESSGSARGRGGETAVSVVLHMLVLAGAVHATERAVASGALHIADTTMIFVTHSPSPARAATPEAPSAPGVRGYVDLDFVIDASGRVEPGSVRVVAPTHGAFVIPATEAILAGVYRPARYRGNAVRQLVRQRVSFQGG
jgi:hypothetical protein